MNKNAGSVVEAELSYECPVCGRVAVERHPCRFEIACSCWRGKPCDGSGKVKRR